MLPHVTQETATTAFFQPPNIFSASNILSISPIGRLEQLAVFGFLTLIQLFGWVRASCEQAMAAFKTAREGKP
jgi:hypothetical protein